LRFYSRRSGSLLRSSSSDGEIDGVKPAALGTLAGSPRNHADSHNLQLTYPAKACRRPRRQRQVLLCRSFVSRRPDSNRGPLHYEGKTSRARASTQGHAGAHSPGNSALLPHRGTSSSLGKSR
jgi:hypothetical protein